MKFTSLNTIKAQIRLDKLMKERIPSIQGILIPSMLWKIKILNEQLINYNRYNTNHKSNHTMKNSKYIYVDRNNSFWVYWWFHGQTYLRKLKNHINEAYLCLPCLIFFIYLKYSKYWISKFLWRLFWKNICFMLIVSYQKISRMHEKLDLFFSCKFAFMIKILYWDLLSIKHEK